MMWRAPAALNCLLMILILAANGCQPLGRSGLDEERDPNYLTGRSRASTGDYRGAAAAYERALLSNPRSAAAHKALGLVFYQHLGDHAAAIYHFQKLLEINPKDPHAEIIQQHIGACKQELASRAPLGPVNAHIQRQIENLDAENRRLRAENTNLVAHIQRLQLELASRTNAPPALAAPAPATPAPLTVPPPGKIMVQPSHVLQQPLSQPQPQPSAPPSLAVRPAAPQAARTHRVRPGETFSSISRLYRIDVNALMAANPRVNPRRLLVGQVLNLP